jgi:2-alkyl-3-oxoalkanoate reductase
VRVAVTGAAGFVGGAVARALAERGHEVDAFTRQRWDVAASTIDGRADAVVHCAALADDRASRAAAMRANVDGTRNVVAGFPGARIVHLSTSSVYDAFTPTRHAREDQPLPRRFLSAYSESKAIAEMLVPPDGVILRPHAVYGPGDTTLLPRVLEAVRGDRLALPAGAAVAHTLTHIRNLVDAVELALTGPPGTYNIGDDGDAVLADVLREFLARRGRADVRVVAIPYRAAFAVASIAERMPGRLTRYAVSQVGLERTLDLTAARERLGYRPTPTSLAGAEHW